MAKNKRCPLQEECEKKCSYQGHELDCTYYHTNARKDYYIEDQEEIRREIDRKADEEYWARHLAEIAEEEDEDEDSKEESEPEKHVDRPKLEVTYLDGPMGVTEKIKKAMYDAAKQFVYIGFLLWEVKQNHYHHEKGYADVYEYAETELGFKRSSTKNFIAISETFGNKYYNSPYARNAILPTMQLKPEYKDFNYSQLCEMLSMSPAKREAVTPDMTIKQIREIKKQSEPDLPPDMETIPILMPEDRAVGQTSGHRETVATVLNTRVQDMPKEVIKEIVKAAGLNFNPKSVYRITIERQKIEY